MRTLHRGGIALLATSLLASPSFGFQMTLDSGAGALTIVDNDGNDLNAEVGLIDFSQVVGGIFSATGRVQQAFGSINRNLYVGTNTAGADAVFANLDSVAHTFTVMVASDTFTAPGPPLGWSLQLDGQATDGAAADVEVATNDLALTVDPGALLLVTASAPITPAVSPAEQPVSFATTLKGVDATADATTMQITWSFNLGPDDEIQLPDPNASAEPRIVASVFNAQDQCVFIMNKKAFKVAKLAGVDDKNCVKLIAKTGGDSTACVDDPNSPKQLKAEQKLISAFPSSCSIPPAFGTNVGTCCEGGSNDAASCVDDLDCPPDGTCTPGACISGGAEVAANTVSHDLFGPTVAVEAGDAGKCQLKVLTALQLLHAERWKSLFKCKKATIAGLATETAFVTACFGPPQPDYGSIPKRQEKLTDTIQSLCLNKGVTSLGTVFPGSCASETDPDFADCLGERAACRFCIGAIESDDLTSPLDCDVFDDGVSNGSCP